MNIETIAYGGWNNCLRVSNAQIEIVITLDVGPRLIRVGFPGGPNHFKEFPETLGQTGGTEWNSYGGHRLWHAPEQMPRTYVPDNEPIQWAEHDNFVRLTPPLESSTGLQKAIDVHLADDTARAYITHRTTNHNVWGAEFAMWALSVMAPGGICVFPLPERGGHPEHLLPASSLTLWRFTDMSDPRWTFGERFIMLRQDETMDSPQKVGALVPDGWAAYANQNQLFVKRFECDPRANYPDFGVNFETFTNGDMLEAETLGPLQVLAPGESVEHREEWAIFDNVPAPQNEDDVENVIVPLVRSVY